MWIISVPKTYNWLLLLGKEQKLALLERSSFVNPFEKTYHFTLLYLMNTLRAKDEVLDS